MDILNDYFKDLVFSRVEEKQGHVIYAARVPSMLGGGVKRYILLFVPSHLAFKTKAKIYELAWENLQTRALSYSYRIPQQNWRPPRIDDDIILQISNRGKQYSTYVPQSVDSFPFEILLIHDSKKKTKFQYHNRLSVIAALDTYNSVFNYIGELSPISHISEPLSSPPPLPIGFSSNFNNWFNIDTADDSFELIDPPT